MAVGSWLSRLGERLDGVGQGFVEVAAPARDQGDGEGAVGRP